MTDSEKIGDIVRPSGQNFSFDVNLASAYGIEEALLIHHFQHWIRFNKIKNINQYEGRTWTYNTYNEIASHFPFLSARQVRRTIDNLVHFNVIRKGNYNKLGADNTVWFAFENEDIFMPDLAKPKPKPPENPTPIPKEETESPPLPKSADPCRNRQPLAEKSRPIPDTKPDAKPYRTTNPTLPPEQVVGGSNGEIEIYQCLRQINISQKDKLRLMEQFKEEVIIKAINHCTKPSFKTKTTLDASIFYYCKNPSYILESKEEIQARKIKEEDAKRDREINRRQAGSQIIKFFWQKAREMSVNFREFTDYLEISNERIKEKIYFSDDKFSSLLSHVLQKIGLETPTFLRGIS